MQDIDYQRAVFPQSVKARLVVEAGVPQGWERWAGDYGEIIGIEKFGASAPYKVLFENYGFTIDNVVLKAHQVLNRLSL